jgi:hypothetical protein
MYVAGSTTAKTEPKKILRIEKKSREETHPSQLHRI